MCIKEVIQKCLVISLGAVLLMSGCGSKNGNAASERVSENVAAAGSEEGTPGKDKQSGSNTDTAVSNDPQTVLDKDNAIETGSMANEKDSNNSDSVSAQKNALPAAPVFSVETQYVKRMEGDAVLVTGECGTPVISGKGYEKVARSIAKWTKETKDAFEETVDDYEIQAREEYGLVPEDSYFSGFSSYDQVYCTRADSRVISFKESCSDYTGGIHGYYGCMGYTYDAVTGDRLELNDILSDPDGFYKRSFDYFKKNLDDMYKEEVDPDNNEYLKEVWGPDLNWYMTASGITVIFNPYEIGSYSMGVLEFSLPYEEFSGEIDPDYLRLNGAGIGLIDENIPTAAGVSPDHSVAIMIEDNPDGIDCRITLVSDDLQEELEDYVRLCSAYLICRENGQQHIVLTTDYASDDFTTINFDVTDGKLYEVQPKLDNCSISEGHVSTNEITLNTHIDVLGTFSSPMIYQMDDDGYLTASSDWYELSSPYGWTDLTVKKPLPVTIDGSKQKLPVGTRIRLTGTDNNGIAAFEIPDTGETGEIHYIKGSEISPYFPVIDGVADYEYFETLGYAG